MAEGRKYMGDSYQSLPLIVVPSTQEELHSRTSSPHENRSPTEEDFSEKKSCVLTPSVVARRSLLAA